MAREAGDPFGLLVLDSLARLKPPEIDENENGRPWFNETRAKEQDHLIERVGADLRKMMPFLDPVTVKPGDGPISPKAEEKEKVEA